MDKHEIWLPIPYAYKPGDCRIYHLWYGPRGGKRQTLLHKTPATGGNLQMFLDKGTYKRTHWSNGWPHCILFEVNTDGSWHFISEIGHII